MSGKNRKKPNIVVSEIDYERLMGLATNVSERLEEIAELRWVTREQLRRTSEVGELLLPGRISIARSLIEHWNGSPLTGAEW